MDGTLLQAKVATGLGRAATHIGTSHKVYRSDTAIDPIGLGTYLSTLPAAFTTGYAFSRYSQPIVPDWTCVIDTNTLQPGDWLVGADTYYIADIQPLLPIPAVQCNRSISINRAGYSTAGALEPTTTLIASNFPVFMTNKKDRERAPMGFPSMQTDTTTGVPSWQFYINMRSNVLKNDIITDDLGTKYVIDIANLTSFGYLVLAHLEKP